MTDQIVYDAYGKGMHAYFEAHKIPLTVHIMPGGEMHKVRRSLLPEVSAFGDVFACA